MGKTRSAFSLVEILAAMGVMATLAALSAAGLTQAVDRARSVKCLNNLKHLGTAAFLCAAENEGRLPKSQHQSDSWIGSLGAYLEGTKTFLCPAYPNRQRLYSYAINDFLTPNPYGAEDLDYSRFQTIPAPSQTLLMAECNETYQASDHFHFADGDMGYAPTAFAAQIAVRRHKNSANYLFADGRVEAISWKTVTAELQNPNSRFIHP